MIKLLALDVDGTLTDGKVYYSDSGEELKAFNIKDGLGLNIWKKLGRKSAIITGRTSSVVELRARELGIDFVFMGIKDKGEVLQRLQGELQITAREIASIGDDLNDLAMFAHSALSFMPKDGSALLKKHVKYILNAKGGEGAVREMIEMILEQEGQGECWFEFFH
ncbi:KdsC family phosphatase [Helicobacter pametensis]|uniref:KdsC family phosphatase n=1 Tax=Helicobacter pametensis TaxID=95149 RepID=UPI0004844EC8|nr:HAD hydrolase family protein [Helicobacter pametensis]